MNQSVSIRHYIGKRDERKGKGGRHHRVPGLVFDGLGGNALSSAGATIKMPRRQAIMPTHRIGQFASMVSVVTESCTRWYKEVAA